MILQLFFILFVLVFIIASATNTKHWTPFVFGLIFCLGFHLSIALLIVGAYSSVIIATAMTMGAFIQFNYQLYNGIADDPFPAV